MSRVFLFSKRNSLPDQRNVIMLKVGLPGNSWTYFVERERLAKKSEWFRTILTNLLVPPLTEPPPLLELQHFDKGVFDHFLRYLYDKPLNFMSVSIARSTLDAAYQYFCSGLVKLTADYLKEHVTSSNVLKIYQGLLLYSFNFNQNEEPRRSFNTLQNSLTASEADETAEACTSLLVKCLSVIDIHPALVLRQECFEELSVEEVCELAKRKTLNLNSECILFSALDRWAAAECRRQSVPEPYSGKHKRAMLSDDIWFSVRYLLMSNQEFVSSVMTSGILSNEECVHIISKILRHPENVNSTATIHPSRLCDTPRIRILYHDENKPDKKERQDNQKNRRKECAKQRQKTCAKIGNCLIQILACIFE